MLQSSHYQVTYNILLIFCSHSETLFICTCLESNEVEDDYTPNAISISSVKAVECDDEKEQSIYIYFDPPTQLRGDEIAYKIEYIDNKDRNDMMEIPYKIPKSVVPCSFQIMTESTINGEKYLSQPSEIITIGYPSLTLIPSKHSVVDQSVLKSKQNVASMLWNKQPSYFMQIISVSEDDFCIRLIAQNINKLKPRKFIIKEIRNDDEVTMTDIPITIKKKKRFAKQDGNIDEDHDNTYHLALYDAKHTDNLIPNANQLEFRVMRDESEYPPSNTKYKPNPIDISTIIKCRDEENDEINIYWQIPSNSFGKISYKIVPNGNGKTESTIIEFLPYSFPSSLLPLSFQVITLTAIEDDDEKLCNCQSVPSNIIRIGNPRQNIDEQTNMELPSS